jgi:hypothetical protein
MSLLYCLCVGIVVLKNGTYCSLLEVVDKSKSGDCLAALLQGLETQRLVGSAPPPGEPLGLQAFAPGLF